MDFKHSYVITRKKIRNSYDHALNPSGIGSNEPNVSLFFEWIPYRDKFVLFP